MKIERISTIIYYALLAIGVAIMIAVTSRFFSLFDSGTELSGMAYANLQKRAGLISIICFMVLLLVSFVLYYLTSKRTYILLSNIFYMGAVLYVFVSLNRNYFDLLGLDYSEESEYWITIFMGIFYIIGAILVSAIGYITVRNYSKRTEKVFNKASRKK